MKSITDILIHPDFLMGVLALAIALVIGGAIILGVRRWVRQESSPEEDVENFRALQEEGELSAEEMDRIRLLVQQKTGEDARMKDEGR